MYTTRKDFESGAPFDFRDPRTISMAGGAVSLSPETVFGGSEKTSSTPSPACRAARSLTATGTSGAGGTGSPGAPQPFTRKIVKRETPNAKLVIPRFSRSGLKKITRAGAPFFRQLEKSRNLNHQSSIAKTTIAMTVFPARFPTQLAFLTSSQFRFSIFDFRISGFELTGCSGSNPGFSQCRSIVC